VIVVVDHDVYPRITASWFWKNALARWVRVEMGAGFHWPMDTRIIGAVQDFGSKDWGNEWQHSRGVCKF